MEKYGFTGTRHFTDTSFTDTRLQMKKDNVSYQGIFLLCLLEGQRLKKKKIQMKS